MNIVIQNASKEKNIPSEAQFIAWTKASLNLKGGRQAEITLRIVDSEESARLNTQYRHKEGPTNVLSFSYTPPPTEIDQPLMGDIVICAAIVEAEAKTQHKPLQAHWAHMVVHGVLHLLGYDHETTQDASIMEPIENSILKSLDFNPPYGELDHQ